MAYCACGCGQEVKKGYKWRYGHGGALALKQRARDPGKAFLRFQTKLTVLPDGCWQWRGHRIRGGYGTFWWNGRKIPAHRFAYEILMGPIPEGLEIDHLCRNRSCVNPQHLELVTSSENKRRGLQGVLRQQSHCKMGHPFDEANTRIDAKGHRTCRVCHNEAATRYIAKHHEYYATKRREYYRKNIEVERAKAREYQRKRRKGDA